MRKIAVLNQKGGVGKTSTAVNLSAALAACGQRVCVVDMDPQAHASLHLGVTSAPGDLSVYNVLTGSASLADVRRHVGENLWLVGSDIDLAAAEVELAGVVGRELILRDQMDIDGDAMDFVLIDCPPSLGVLTINALAAADEVFIPLQPHFLPLHGLSKLLETIHLVSKRLNPKLKLGGVLLCLYEAGTRLATEISQDVIDFLENSRAQNTPWSQAKVFQTRIRRNIRIAEAPSFGQSILAYAPDSHGATDYLALAQEILDDMRPGPVELNGTAAVPLKIMCEPVPECLDEVVREEVEQVISEEVVSDASALDADLQDAAVAAPEEKRADAQPLAFKKVFARG